MVPLASASGHTTLATPTRVSENSVGTLPRQQPWIALTAACERSQDSEDRLGPRSTVATTHDVRKPVLPREGRENEESEVYSPFYWALPASKQGGSMCQEQQGT